MSRDTNLATVQAIYTAFGTGDVPTLLSLLDADIEWVNPGPDDIPAYFGTKHGHEGALSVLGYLGANVDISVFDPHTFVADDDRVVALVHFVGTAKATGRTYDQEIVHVFEFGPAGTITRFRDVQHTYEVVGALRA